MEIVPILSTIILVGTVATFILAVAAYILYKMREGGGRNVPQNTQTEQIQPHHIVTPVDYSSMVGQHEYFGSSEAATFNPPAPAIPPQGPYIETNNEYNSDVNHMNGVGGQVSALSHGNQQGVSLDSFFWEYTDNGFSPMGSEENKVDIPQDPDHEEPEES